MILRFWANLLGFVFEVAAILVISIGREMLYSAVDNFRPEHGAMLQAAPAVGAFYAACCVAVLLLFLGCILHLLAMIDRRLERASRLAPALPIASQQGGGPQAQADPRSLWARFWDFMSS